MRIFAIILLAILFIIWLAFKMIGIVIFTIFFLAKLGGTILVLFLLYLIFRPRK